MKEMSPPQPARPGSGVVWLARDTAATDHASRAAGQDRHGRHLHQLYVERPRRGILDRQGVAGARPRAAHPRVGDQVRRRHLRLDEERHDAADHVLSVVSDEYLKAPYSTLERNAALWQAAAKGPGFVLFVAVKPCGLPSLIDHYRGCELYGLSDGEARRRFQAFMDKPADAAPIAFPGEAFALDDGYEPQPIDEKARGSEHPYTALSLNCVAGLLRDLGQPDEAESLFRRGIAISEKALGVGHPLTQRYQSQYARLLMMTDRTAEAFRIGETAVATHERINGPNHPWTKDSARITADALDALGRADEATALRTRYGIGASSS